MSNKPQTLEERARRFCEQNKAHPGWEHMLCSKFAHAEIEALRERINKLHFITPDEFISDWIDKDEVLKEIDEQLK